jgi:flavodoxin
MENWKSLYIYYISGTGNARASSEWIADEAAKELNQYLRDVKGL